MRSRGASAADIAILVVAANDGVQEQTKESIAHIKSAKIPFLVAITKIDMPNISIEKVKKQLSVAGVQVEGFGGEIVCIPISAKQKQGLDELLDMIILMWEMDENSKNQKTKKENKKQAAESRFIVIESYLDNKKGPVIHAVVKSGQFKTEDRIFVEGVEGKIRALISDKGKKVEKAEEGDPVEILGFEKVVPVGSVGSTEKLAQLSKSVQSTPKESENPINDNSSDEEKTAERKKLNVILKTDNEGSLEAIRYSLPPEINLLLSGTGNVSEGDILLAKTTRSFVVGFNVEVPQSVSKLAETEGVSFKTYKIIYEMLEELKEVSDSINEVTATEKIVGAAEILQDFLGTKNRIAGCKVLEGKFNIGDKVRVERGEKVVGESKVASLKVFKKDVQKVVSGEECGIVLLPEVDFRIGDVIVCAKPIGKK